MLFKIYFATMVFYLITLWCARGNIERANLVYYGLHDEILIEEEKLFFISFVPLLNVWVGVKLIIFAMLDKSELEKVIRNNF